MARELLLNVHNHLDPTWRRCFDRDAEFHGVTVKSYADVEELCFKRWLELAPRGYTYTEGQTAVWRKFIERNPDKVEDLKKYAKAGIFEMVMAGEVIPDSNLPAAEGLVRNYLLAMPFYKALVGRDHPGLKVGWVFDAFGNNPNLPQIMKGVGAEAVFMLTYRTCGGPVMEGIDGTVIPTNEKFIWTRPGFFEKHPPCPACSGKGCRTCGGRGMLVVDGFPREKIRETLENAAAWKEEWVEVFVVTEEILPDPGLFKIMEEFKADHEGNCTVRFSTSSETLVRTKEQIETWLAEYKPGTPHDLNPAMPGCYVSRIRTKQRTRDLAYRLCRAEAAAANASWGKGTPERYPSDLTEAWRLVAFNQFHDAITGTHIDNAYVELMEMLDRAEVLVPALPAVTARTVSLKKVKTQPAKVRVGIFDLDIDTAGIVTVGLDGLDLFGPIPSLNRIRRPLRIGELFLEPDFGDAWGQRIAPFPGLDRGLIGVPLGEFNTSVEAGDNIVQWKGAYKGGDPKVKKLKWTVTVKAGADGRRLDFTTEVEWNTGSRRLRAVFPVPSSDPDALYEVPFGHIRRTFDLEKLDYSQGKANTMEFAAMNWVAKPYTPKASSPLGGEDRGEGADGGGVAFFNKGLPCWRWMPAHMDVSLLRSPEWNFCIVEPHNYEFWDIDGQRDTGTHRFEYALYPYGPETGIGDISRMGAAFNMGVIDLPFTVEGDVTVTAWKPAEDAGGWVLRLHEAGGKGTPVTLVFDRECTVTRTNLLEEPLDEPVTGTRYMYDLHKHGILTLKIKQGL